MTQIEFEPCITAGYTELWWFGRSEAAGWDAVARSEAAGWDAVHGAQVQ